MIVRQLRSIIAPIFAAILLEIVVFNFSPLSSTVQHKQSYKYSMDELTFVNWEEKDGVLVSGIDPMIIKNDLSIAAETVTIRLHAEPQPENYDIFYTIDSNEQLSADRMLSLTGMTGEDTIDIDKHIAAIRIDPGDEAGRKLYDISIIFNEVSWNISISRIIAMLVIWWGTKGLLKLQESPDYDIGETSENHIKTA